MEEQTHRSLIRGQQLMLRGGYEEALKEFAKAVIKTPNNAQAHRMLGSAYYWTGKVDQAQAEFEEALRLDPDSAQGHLLMGIVFAWKGNMRLAYDHFKRGAELDPNRADLQMDLGSIEETRGDFQTALKHYRKAAELEPKNPLYHFQLGTIYGRLGRYEDSVDELSAAIKLFPGYEDALLELGAVYERLGRKKEALGAYQRCVKLKKRDSVARLRLARVHLLLREEDKARDALREVFHLTPASRSGLALSVAYGGKPQGAEGGGEGKPERTNPKEPREPKGPTDLLKRNLSRIPLDQEALLRVNVAFLTKPKHQLVRRDKVESGSLLKDELARAGSAPSSSMLGAKREYRLRPASPSERGAEIRRVLADLRDVLDSAPPGSETRMDMNLSFSPRASSASSKPQDRGRVSYQPRDVGNDMQLWVMGTGWMLLVQEVLNRRWERVLHGDSPMWHVLYGIAHASLGKARDSADSFVKALEVDPDSELAHLGLGVARVISGDEKGAVEAYRRALAINPKNRAAAEGLQWLLREPVAEEKVEKK